ncbi:hypothetical protein NIES4071_83420 [Calothrix sp. NIES-4071]|nr:hypothetical protein NIES4071_83420 [Calothrix sp. NIES-4071]BAZ62610.1 hypothetical protein NIES4105_83350 [Calothrix sp. NIES-4105]
MSDFKGFKPLLAKSLPKKGSKDYSEQARGAAKYTGHISLVMQAADVLVEVLGEQILKQLGLIDVDLKYFAKTVKLGAYLHDWGKANQHFQEMVYWKSLDLQSKEPKVVNFKKVLKELAQTHSDRQMLRHEIISGILALQVPSIKEWLGKCEDVDLVAAVWAAMGHHLKTGVNKDDKPAEFIAEISDGTGGELNIYTHHQDFEAILKMGCKYLGLPEQLPELPKETWSKSELQTALNLLRDEFIKLESNLTWEQQKFIAAVKATVMAADLAGSALPLVEEDFKSWMQEVLSLTLSSEEIQRLVNQRLEGQPLRPFQKKIAQASRRVTLVKAGCGTGKTVGAYAWAEKWAVNRKLFFCYPTTGTASQGFIDYAEGTDIEAELMHSRADLDRELLFSGDSDESEGIDARLSAFTAWRKKLLVCTVDTVLGLIQNNRKPLYAWTAIAQSAFVFDEVHAYDARLFGALLEFIKTFRGAPILLMSASFTPGQLTKIREAMAELGEKIDEPIEGPEELEKLKRYEIRQLTEVSDSKDMPEVWESVLEALKNRQKVLWVTNSVQSCIDLYRQAKIQVQKLPVEANPLIYHSRFRYRDRVSKHKAVIDAFRTNEPVLAITTQVCEMSLDLSADLLVSAMAPFSALIQRLGRLNRRMSKPEEGTGLAIIYPWKNNKPYKATELNTGKDLLNRLTDKSAVSQHDLSEIAAELSSNIPESVKSIWLEGNWCAYPDFLRQPGYTVTVLLQDDLTSIKDAALLRSDKSFMREAQGWSVPVHIDKNLYDWRRIKFYPIAAPEDIYYSEETGAEPCK